MKIEELRLHGRVMVFKGVKKLAGDDLSAPDASEQCQTVESILGDLELSDKPRITVLNKIDLLLDGGRTWDEASALGCFSDQPRDKDTVLISAVKGWGLDELRELINQTLSRVSQPV